MSTRDPGKPGAEDDLIDGLPIEELPLHPLSIEKAPASLSRRLYRIPLEHGPHEQGPLESARIPARMAFGLPGWALSVGVAAAAVVAVALIIDLRDGKAPEAGPQVAVDPPPGAVTGPENHSGAEPQSVAEARRDLAIAFSYLDKAGLRTSREIRAVLHEELAVPVKDNLSKHIPYMAQAPKEKQA